MAKIGFGGRMLKHPTPASFERFVKMWIGITGLFLAWMPTNNIVPIGFQEVFTPINNLVNSVFIFLLPYFGVKTDESSIPVQDVTSMETNPEKPVE